MAFQFSLRCLSQSLPRLSPSIVVSTRSLTCLLCFTFTTTSPTTGRDLTVNVYNWRLDFSTLAQGNTSLNFFSDTIMIYYTNYPVYTYYSSRVYGTHQSLCPLVTPSLRSGVTAQEHRDSKSRSSLGHSV